MLKVLSKKCKCFRILRIVILGKIFYDVIKMKGLWLVDHIMRYVS